MAETAANARRERGGAESEHNATKDERQRPLPRREAAVLIAGDCDDDGKIIFNYGWWLGSVKERSVATRRGRCRVRSELPKTSENKRGENVIIRGKALLSGSNDGAASWSCDFL